MTYKDYIEKLKLLKLALEKRTMDIKLVEEDLEVLYDIKPVDLKWFVVHGLLLIKKGQYEEYISQYKGRISPDGTYEENISMWKMLISAYEKSGQITEASRQKYLLNKLLQNKDGLKVTEELNKQKNIWIEGKESAEQLMFVEELYYTTNQKLLAYMMYLYRVKRFPDTADSNRLNMYLSYSNMGYLDECIRDKETVILVSEDENTADYDVLAYLLHEQEVPVFLIGESVEIEGTYRIEDSVAVSIENAQEYEDCIMVPSVMRLQEGQAIEDNIPHMIDYLCKNKTAKDFAIVITSNKMIDNLCYNEFLSKRIERRNEYEADYLEDEIGFGTAGDYYTYISRLYGMDVRPLVYREPEYDFSIVIPVRNVSETLYYTIKTCLEQEYDGTYEVVISDNSTEENSTAYEIVSRFQDKRLKYYKTPRDLGLVKSFEYAYLQTKGNFIIPIGGDDGILPWALNKLGDIISNEVCSGMEIITWDRGFYAWPGYNGGQQHQLAIPAFYRKNHIDVSRDNPQIMWARLLKNPMEKYVLANTYLNSGFFRNYLVSLYQKTGRILDGFSQDIYMGLLNIFIKTPYIRVKYPLTIAGMSSSSVGSICNDVSSGISKNAEEQLCKLLSGKSMNDAVKSMKNVMIPMHKSDVSTLYDMIEILANKYHGIHKGYTEEEYKIIYRNCYEALLITGDTYCKYIMEGYELAKRISLDFAKWYKEEIGSRAEKIWYITKEDIEKSSQKKRYHEGYISNGGVTLDASRYGVSNVHEAVELFRTFLNW